jgi:hypothetical protein
MMLVIFDDGFSLASILCEYTKKFTQKHKKKFNLETLE